jgi:pimeloyl-ACP methyl ester carboxylesterase
MVATDLIEVRDGRRVQVHVQDGAPAGPTVLFCHGAPGAGLLDPEPAATAARGVTLLGVDRPGYGGSEPLPNGTWPSVASAADDAADVLERLGHRRVGVVGWSAGGRVAVALAARRPDLVDRVVVAGTPAPNEDVPWIPAEHAAALEGLRTLKPDQALAALMEQVAPLVEAAKDPDVALELIGRGPADDDALAAPGVRDRLLATIEAAFVQGPAGLVADIAGYTLRPWAFEPATVAAKTLLLYGSVDPVAGSAHGRWWQRNLANARLEMVPGAGHLLIIPTWRRVLSHLAPRR